MGQPSAEHHAEQARHYIQSLRSDIEMSVQLRCVLVTSDPFMERMAETSGPGVQILSLLQRSSAFTALSLTARAYDPGPDCASFPNIFRILALTDVQKKLSAGASPEADFALASDRWAHLQTLSSFLGLRHGILSGSGKGTSLIEIIRRIRNSQAAHNLPFKSARPPGATFTDLWNLIDQNCQIIEPLCRAVGLVDLKTETTEAIWRKRALAFWSQQER